MNKHTSFAWVIYNIANMACWTLLALAFGRWWIALFSILFFATMKNGERYFYCDHCGAISPTGKNLEEADKKGREAGWIRRKTEKGWEDICPDCQRKERGGL